MTCSPARLAANRANSLRSCGPKTPEGKARSRANSLKHGMAGSGIVVPPVDSAEVERRTAAMQDEMRPRTEMGRYLVGRLAELTVRVERCSRQERAAHDLRVTHAEAAFDEARIAEVDHAISWIRDEPATHARKLRSMPEGVDRIIANLLELRDELDLNGPRWQWVDGERLANLTGQRYLEVPTSPIMAYSEAVMGKFQHLLPTDGEGLSVENRRIWARGRLVEIIDAELDALLAYRETLDLEAIEDDRAGAADRALFDPSKEATLARRYEAAADRGVYRALRELERVEAQAEAPAPDEFEADHEALGSSGIAGARAEPRPAMPLARPVAPSSPGLPRSERSDEGGRGTS